MKRLHLLVFIFLFSIAFFSCMVNYPTTTFYVKNTSNKTLNFKASVIKYSSMGPFEMTIPFSIPPHDSVMARKVGYKKDALPTGWFTQFIIFPTDSILFNDPKNQANWIKSTDPEGRPIYTFTMSK